MWNGDKEPDCCDEYWDDLDEEQRQAATVLGYDKESWDKGGDKRASLLVSLLLSSPSLKYLMSMTSFDYDDFGRDCCNAQQVKHLEVVSKSDPNDEHLDKKDIRWARSGEAKFQVHDRTKKH
eukprot:scaffold5742_cov91-Skeletonema_dohrnii-CCMP3373.AAC.1